MKTTIKLAAVILLIFITSISIFASNNIGYNDHDIEIIFAEDTTFTESQKISIENHLTGQKNIITTRGILCLFGHNLTVERVVTKQHRYYSTSPRCLLQTYDISSCSRCDYVSSNLINSVRIICFP